MAKDRPAPLPWTRFSYDDFFRDHAVERMTNEQVGAYLRLLHAAWVSFPPGWLPTDSDYLGSVSRLGDAWPQHAPCILRAFQSKGDHLEQRRIVEEYKAARKEQEINSRRGLAAARVRWSEHASSMQTECLGVTEKRVESREIEKEEETHTLLDAGAPSCAWAARFQSWWDLYDKKVGRAACLKLWSKLSPKGEALYTAIMQGTERFLTWDRVKRGFKLDPERFLKRRIWEDEGEPQGQDEWARWEKGGSR
jgi:uncharacterized protein YdaU (DUF1376 family)